MNTTDTLPYARIIISTIDKLATENQGWVNLELKIQDIIKYPYETFAWKNEVVSVLGIHVGFFENQVFIDLEPYTDEPAGKEDFEKPNCLFIGKECK